MTTLEPSIRDGVDRAILIRRVNQLYHELVHARFDEDHRFRHQVERRFWQEVGIIALPARNDPGRAASVATGGRVVLDLACGTGFVSRMLLPRICAPDRLLAMDLGRSPLHKTIEIAGKVAAVRTRIMPCIADAHHIPLASASVDFIAMNASLHHLSDPLEALRSVDRVLKPGGLFALGFEPNRGHFQSPAATLSAGFSRACWYASPKQNWRRLSRRLLRERGLPNSPDGSDDVLARCINRQLLSEGVCGVPLSTSDMLDLVDPFARGGAGFDPDVLLQSAMRDYQPVLLAFSDYLGESARRWPIMRTMVDTILQKLLPGRGSLFSWLIRKPGGAPRRGAS